MTSVNKVIVFLILFVSFRAQADQANNFGVAMACGSASITTFARELKDRAETLMFGEQEQPKNSVTVTLPAPKPHKKSLPEYCPTKTGRYAAKSRPVSYYGDGTDGFAGKDVACASQLPAMRKMEPNALRVALRTDIFKRLMAKTGKEYSKRNICGAKIILHRPGLKTPVIATVVDNGDLGLTKKKIKPMRDVDLSPAVRKKLQITTDEGLALDVTYVVCDI